MSLINYFSLLFSRRRSSRISTGLCEVPGERIPATSATNLSFPAEYQPRRRQFKETSNSGQQESGTNFNESSSSAASSAHSSLWQHPPGPVPATELQHHPQRHPQRHLTLSPGSCIPVLRIFLTFYCTFFRHVNKDEFYSEVSKESSNVFFVFTLEFWPLNHK